MAPQSPRYKHYDLGRQPVGTMVEVALSSINNVRLMDDKNFKLYTRAQPYKFFGGLILKTPARMTVPDAGHWHVIIDREGLPTLANSNVRTVQPGPAKVPVFIEAAPEPMLKPLETETDAPPAAQNSNQTDEILKALDEFKRIANTDALTGLNNRRAFDEKIAAVFAIEPEQRKSVLLVADVDHFKKFNDTYGHLVGDKVLVTVAATLKANLRKDIFLARTGGEEFAVIVEDATAEEALKVADRVRKALAAKPFTDEESGEDFGRITISMGLCSTGDAADTQDVYAKADAALYASKKAGRNRCTIFSADMKAAKPHARPKAAAAS